MVLFYATREGEKVEPGPTDEAREPPKIKDGPELSTTPVPGVAESSQQVYKVQSSTLPAKSATLPEQRDHPPLSPTLKKTEPPEEHVS